MESENMKNQTNNELPRCPKCGEIVEEIWENNGFNPPDPTHCEAVGYKCEVHGEVEPVWNTKK